MPNKPRSFHRPTAVRWLAIAFTLVLAICATAGYASVLNADGRIGVFEWLTLPLFAMLFAWVAFSFFLATIGFIVLTKERSWLMMTHKFVFIPKGYQPFAVDER